MSNMESLGDRMKSNYEDRYRVTLPRRTNVIIRVDGKAFHTYTQGLKKPYDQGLMDDMDATAKFLCENIQGSRMAYVQSDEISVLLHDYNTLQTDAWFDNNLQKMCSISAALATAEFNRLRMYRKCTEDGEFQGHLDGDDLYHFRMALFDSRVFIIPEQEEVVNYFIWRQQDATRNSLQMAARSEFSHGEVDNKNTSEMNEMLMTKGINWNDYPTRFKRGTMVVKETETWIRKRDEKGPGHRIPLGERIVKIPDTHISYERGSWNPVEIPVFTQDREFILSRIVEKETVE